MARRTVLLLANGPEERVAAMRADVERVLPGYAVESADWKAGDSAGEAWLGLVRRHPPMTLAHVAVLVGGEAAGEALGTALALAPMRVLAYNEAGERFHLHPRHTVASWLFLRGWPVHAIHWRPWRDDTKHYDEVRRVEGKEKLAGRPTIAVLSPYLPWPLSHGGAVRIYSLLAASGARWNIELFAFTEPGDAGEVGPLREHCTGITLVRKPDYGRLRWASREPAEVVEYWTPAMARALRETGHDLLQTEFTQLASYGGDVLVEHDITMDLAEQEHRRVGSWRSRWNLWRWQRYEQAAIGRYRAIVTMSEKDKAQISHPRVVVVANGVDLERFRPLEEVDGERMLFIGSFRHYPNALAYRFLAEEFWPRYRDRHKGAVLEVVAGPKPEFYYPFGRVPRAEGIELHGFVGDVAPCYARANLVLIPTPVSAGTNIKALEAMAAGRAILATPSGVNGLGLRAGEEVAIAEGAEAFVAAAEKLLADGGKRRAMAAAARRVAEERYGWAALARRQEALWQELLEGR